MAKVAQIANFVEEELNEQEIQEWLAGGKIGDLWVGATYREAFTFDQDWLDRFILFSKDMNRIHTEGGMGFDKPIVHFVGLINFVSEVAGTRFPGSGSVMCGMTELMVRKPVMIGDTLGLALEVMKVRKVRKQVVLKLQATLRVNGEDVLRPSPILTVYAPA